MDVVRLLAISRRYGRAPFAAANFLGRFVRYGVFAFATYWFNLGYVAPLALLALAVFLAIVKVMWQIYFKAGKPGWASIIPIYNMIVLLEIVDKPVWWILLFFVPIVNFVIAVIVCVELAKVFGKGAGFGIGLFFLGIIFFPILGFSDAKYVGASSAVPLAADCPLRLDTAAPTRQRRPFSGWETK